MPDINTITEGALNGNGVFDKLMQTVTKHIDDQFGQGSIDSAAYAEVYVGSLNVILQNAINFSLQNERQAEELKLIQAQTALTQEQTLTEQATRDKVAAEITVAEAQKLNLEADRAFTEARTAQTALESTRYTAETPKYLDRLDNEILAITKQNALTDEQILVAKQDVLKSQGEVALLTEQTALTTKQIEVATQDILKGVEEINVLKQSVIKSGKEIDLITSQITKIGKENLRIDAEKALLDQKKTTEQGQTQDLSTGVIGAQQNLYKKQADGFIEDAKVKKTKAVADVYAVAKSNDPTAVADPTNMLTKLTSLIDGL